MLVRFAFNPEGEHLEGFDAEYLQMVGVAVSKRVRQSVATDEKSFIHCCCEEGGLISNPMDETRMKVFDVTSPNMVSDIIRMIGLGGVFFYCSPCAAVSTWQRLSLGLAKQNGWDNSSVEVD